MRTDLAIQFQDASTRAHDLLARLTHTAKTEGRAVSPAEKASIDQALAEVESLRKRYQAATSDAAMTAQINHLTGGAPSMSSSSNGARGGSLGQQFVSSEVMRFLTDPNRPRAGSWNSPSAELGIPTLHATTLDGSPGSGGPLVLADTRPGIVPLPMRPIIVADLLAPGSTTSNAVTFLAEKAVVNAAAAVLEGAAKPESSLSFQQVTELVRKIATWLPVTDEMLTDVQQLATYIDSRLRTFVQLEEDDQLLNGDGVAPNLLGLLHRLGLAPAIPRGADTNEDAIAKQVAAIAVSSNLMPDGVIMHPSNFLTIQLRKNSTGDYINVTGALASLMNPMLWGLPAALTTAMPLGTALVGAFKQAAQIFRNGGLRVEASNSHQDFFTKNLVAIRAEERLALAVYREGAMGQVTGLN